MIKINVKHGESIDKALKRFKRRVIETGLMQEVRRRQEYKKPSAIKRDTNLKAIFKQKKFGNI